MGGLIAFLLSGKKVKMGSASWNGYFPTDPSPFTDPCFVYLDGVETLRIRPEVPIIGYRVSEDLWLFYLMPLLERSEIKLFAKQHHVSLIDWEDRDVILERWDEINALKEKIGDEPLPEDGFWFDKGFDSRIWDTTKQEEADSFEYQVADALFKIKR